MIKLHWNNLKPSKDIIEIEPSPVFDSIVVYITRKGKKEYHGYWSITKSSLKRVLDIQYKLLL